MMPVTGPVWSATWVFWVIRGDHVCPGCHLSGLGDLGVLDVSCVLSDLGDLALGDWVTCVTCSRLPEEDVLR